MKSIMITLDSLEDHQHYLKEAFEVAKRLQVKQLYLLDVLDTAEIELALAQEEDLLKEQTAKKQASLAALIAQLKSDYPDLTIEGDVLVGNPKQEILQAATKREIGLVITASHHYSNVAYILSHGSVSAYLAKHLACNLLILNTDI